MWSGNTLKAAVYGSAPCSLMRTHRRGYRLSTNTLETLCPEAQGREHLACDTLPCVHVRMGVYVKACARVLCCWVFFIFCVSCVDQVAQYGQHSLVNERILYEECCDRQGSRQGTEHTHTHHADTHTHTEEIRVGSSCLGAQNKPNINQFMGAGNIV